MDSDLKGLSRAWIENDSRTSELLRQSPERAEQLVVRMAEALDRRRRIEQSKMSGSAVEIAVTASLSESCLGGASGIQPDALDQLEKLVAQQIKRQE